MKAWVLHDIGDIRYEEVPMPEPAAGEVLIRVGAAGICGSDIPRYMIPEPTGCRLYRDMNLPVKL